MNTVLPEPDSIKTAAYVVFGLLIPFAAFFLGIVIRYKLKIIFPRDNMSLGQLCLIGVLFSIFTVAPLIPSFQGYSSPEKIQSYLLTMAVVIQAGLFMPESLARLISKQTSPANPH